MSVSKKILNDAHIALLDNGQIALCDETKKGELRIHRIITREEVANLIKTFFIQFKHDNPSVDVMQLPFGEDSILAIAALPIEKKAE